MARESLVKEMNSHSSYSKEWSNDFTSVNRDTPSGIMLRKFWHPVLLSTDLAIGSSRHVRVLGEDLLAYRTNSGALGLARLHCPHRGASLKYGYIEQDGIRCTYHGWKLDRQGIVQECPFGFPAYSLHSSSLLIQEMCGIVFVYLDEDDAAACLPEWDIMISEGHELTVQRYPVRCNWFQFQENAADPTHTYYTHAIKFRSLGIPESSGFGEKLVWYAFDAHDFGIVKGWLYEERSVGWGNLAIFPNILRIHGEMHWRTPIDNENTLIFQLSHRPMTLWRDINIDRFQIQKDRQVIEIESPPLFQDETNQAVYSSISFQGQDAAVCASQGSRVDRRRESLCQSDLGVLMYRNKWQSLCSAGVNSSFVYESLRSSKSVLDCRRFMSSTGVVASRPVDKASLTETHTHLPWGSAFGPSAIVVGVPRGSAGRGPLG